MSDPEPSRRREAAEALLAWYRPLRRRYPWRGTRDPYAVWVSEVMLQQTQAARVVAPFEAFIARFPDVAALAASRRSDVVRAWGRLGYPRRAVSLHRAARLVVDEHGGRLPRDVETLRTLPGIGPYTANAIAAIAYGRAVPSLETNVRRITARTSFAAEPDEVSVAELATAAQAWIPARRVAAWTQALMDLGRDVCRPLRPACDVCPLASACAFREAGRVGRRSSRPQPRFEGSVRQARGRILAEAREARSVPVDDLAAKLGVPPARADEALAGLARDGLVVVARGRVRLA